MGARRELHPRRDRQLWAASSLGEIDGDHESGDHEEPKGQHSWHFVHPDILTRLLDCWTDAGRTADECRSADRHGVRLRRRLLLPSRQ